MLWMCNIMSAVQKVNTLEHLSHLKELNQMSGIQIPSVVDLFTNRTMVNIYE